MAKQESLLPRILCLHGAGSNGAIFRVQGRKIFSALGKDFQFVFIEAPFLSTPGPGMELFADSGPFYRWQCDMGASLSFDITTDEVNAERDKVRALLEDHLLKKDDGQALFVGIMAFSQGARVATGLLMHLAQMRRRGRTDDFYDIKFAIINNATYPPLYLNDEMTAAPERVMIPTLHIHGSNDPWRPESEHMLAEFFDLSCATVAGFTGKHQLPLAKDDVDEVVTAIRRLSANATQDI
ncbi:Esterase FUS5 [Metarhizium anisopliae]|nr:Esterase FUS5 [Metarhizium anisopliae]